MMALSTSTLGPSPRRIALRVAAGCRALLSMLVLGTAIHRLVRAFPGSQGCARQVPHSSDQPRAGLPDAICLVTLECMAAPARPPQDYGSSRALSRRERR